MPAQWRTLDINPSLYQTNDILGDTGGLLSLEVLEPSKAASKSSSKRKREQNTSAPLDTTSQAQQILQQLLQQHSTSTSDDAADDGSVGDEQQQVTVTGGHKHGVDNTVKTQKQKTKNKSKKSKSVTPLHTVTPTSSDHTDAPVPQSDRTAWHALGLHHTLCHAVVQCNMTEPTSVQQQSIPAAALHYKHVVAASATGTGKTLAFILPVLHRYITQVYKMCDGDIESIDVNDSKYERAAMFALVITPTRELAIQIVEHTNRIIKALHSTKLQQLIGKAIAVVGGISAAKQQRLISYKPPIVVGTPGRLWDLINATNNTDIAYMQHYKQLAFVVLDEVDRLIANAAYPELKDIIQYVSKQRSDMLGVVDSLDDDMFVTDDGKAGRYQTLRRLDDNGEDAVNDVTNEQSDNNNTTIQPKPAGVKPSKLQILCFSATLNLTATERITSKTKGKKPKHEYDILNELDKYVVFDSKPHMINLASQNTSAIPTDAKSTATTAAQHVKQERTDVVPTKLAEQRIMCTTQNKDYYLYYYLLQHPGKTIIFVNAISCVRRLYSLLSILRLKVFSLHANMQQRQRLKMLDQFKASTNGVIVSTDVAARGLDITDIQYVVHYQFARSVEVYVHRAGRTARAGRDGTSVALISEMDQIAYNKLVAMSDRIITDVPIETTIFNMCVKRVNLCKKIDVLVHAANNSKHSRDWLHKNATELDLIVDSEHSDDNDDEAESMHSKRLHDNKVKALQREMDELLAQQVHGGMKRKFHTYEAHKMMDQQMKFEFKFK